MDFTREFEVLYDLIAKDDTEDALTRLLVIAKQWDLPFRNEVILLSNQFHAYKKGLEVGGQPDEATYQQLNLDLLNMLDRIKLDEALGLKSMKQLIEDLTESRTMAVELEQQLVIAQRSVRSLRKQLGEEE